MITATIRYRYNGLPRQKSVFAETEEELLTDSFNFTVEELARGRHIDIETVEYQGNRLRWNDFLAHNHFAKGRLTFEEFKTLCSTANMSVARCN